MIWNTQTGGQTTVLQRQFDPDAGMERISSFYWSPARPWVATTDQCTMYILDAEK